MELNAEDIAAYMNEGEGVKEAILLMENIFGQNSQTLRQLSHDIGTIKINGDQHSMDSQDDSETRTMDEKPYLDGLTVRARLKGNLLALWDFDSSSLLSGRHQPPPPQFLFVLERVVAQLAEPTPTLPYAFSLTFTNEDTSRTEQFRFSAFSEQDRADWVQAIASCSHELLEARIRAIADGIKEITPDGTVRMLTDSSEREESPFYEFVKKPTLTRAAPLNKSTVTTSSSSSASWSSAGPATTNSDSSPLEPDGDVDAFSALYANIITKKLSLETGRGVLRIREDMAEPKVSLIVPPAILDICIRCAKSTIGHLNDIFYLPPNWESMRQLHVKRLQQFCDRLEVGRKFMANYDGPPFKASRSKGVDDMAFVPTNLHLQRFSVWDSSKAIWHSHDFFTSGCFMAFSEGFSDGGARRTRQKLRQYSSTIGTNENGTTMTAAVDYDFAKMTFWQNELNDVGNRLEQLKLRLHKWSPKSVDDLRNVGKFAAEVRTLSEQLRQLCDSVPRIESAIGELATFYHQYETVKKSRTSMNDSNDGSSSGRMNTSTDSGEFSMETLESQREDFEAELACLITKVENLSKVDETSFEGAGADRDAWVSSFTSAAGGVIHRIEKLRRSIMDGLFYGMLRALSTTESSSLHYDLLYRHVVIVSQALASVTAALLHELWMNDSDRLERCTASWSRCGALVVIHSYLSCYQDENGMMEDMAEVTRLLREYCAFRVAKSFSGVKNCASPIVEGEYGHFKITLPVPNRAWMRLPETLRRGEWFYLVPAYWNVGINHEQTLASKFGGTALESEVNEVAYKTLRGYVKRLTNCENSQSTCDKARRILDQLCSMLCQNETKNVQILTLSTKLCRILNGILFVSCKSGKDRTGMGVTLEEALVLQREYGMPDSHFQASLDALRKDGTRLENTLKNVGERKYAFGSLHLPFLPEWYRPPKGTYGKIQT